MSVYLDPDVEKVLAIGRSAPGVQHPKLRELVQGDLWNYSSMRASYRLRRVFLLPGRDVCRDVGGPGPLRITYGITVAAAETLARLNIGMTFVFVFSAGADELSEQGRLMWARVKGRTENAILRMPFKASYAFRPGVVQPMHGERSRTAAYRVLYSITKPLLPVLRRLWPGQILTTEQFGRAMLLVVRHGAPKRVLESADINALVP